MEIPKEVDVTITVQLSESDSIAIYANDQCVPNGWMTLATHKLKVKIPPITVNEVMLKKVDYLEKSKQKLEQETFQKLKFIDEQIQSLLAIENKSDEADTKIQEVDDNNLPF